MARESETKERFSSTAIVIVNVQDENDNDPSNGGVIRVSWWRARPFSEKVLAILVAILLIILTVTISTLVDIYLKLGRQLKTQAINDDGEIFGEFQQVTVRSYSFLYLRLHF